MGCCESREKAEAIPNQNDKLSTNSQKDQTIEEQNRLHPSTPRPARRLSASRPGETKSDEIEEDGGHREAGEGGTATHITTEVQEADRDKPQSRETTVERDVPEPQADTYKPIQLEGSQPEPILPAAIAPEALFHGAPLSHLGFDYSSKDFRDLETYILSLDSSPKWKPFGSSPGISGFKLSRSKYSSEVPVLRVEISFDRGVSPEFALNMFGEPSFRMAWDQRIPQMNKIYNAKERHFLHYHIVRFNDPLKNREFLTLYYMRKIGNEYRIVLRSTKDKEFPESEQIERAKTFFGMYRVFDEPAGTRMSIIIQFNLFLPLKRIEELVPAFILKWLGKYKEQTEERYNS